MKDILLEHSLTIFENIYVLVGNLACKADIYIYIYIHMFYFIFFISIVSFYYLSDLVFLLLFSSHMQRLSHVGNKVLIFAKLTSRLKATSFKIIFVQNYLHLIVSFWKSIFVQNWLVSLKFVSVIDDVTIIL